MLRATPKAVAAASTVAKGVGGMGVVMHTPVKAVDNGQPMSSLESTFDRLEAQETAAKKQRQYICEAPAKSVWMFSDRNVVRRQRKSGTLL